MNIRPDHHCGFDFSNGLATAVCNCGAVATNPYYMEQPARTPEQLWSEAVAYGKAVENDRIIELIEERAKDFLRSEYDRWLRNEVVIFDTEGLIALIKGEK
jgi:hypothetical protein